MRRFVVTLPEVAFIAATRGMLGFGAGLLLSSRFSESKRSSIGWALVSVGVLTTIPAARHLFGRRSVPTMNA